MRVACIGAGGVAARQLRDFSSIDGVEVAAVFARRIEAARELAGHHDATAFDDISTMLDAVQPDAVVICLIPSQHGAVELDLVRRGIPFLVEKPLATDLQTAERVAAAVDSARLVTAVGYQWRYENAVGRIAQFLGDREVALAEGKWLSTTPPPTWWTRQEESGGQIVEQLTHIIDVARFLTGEMSSLTALGKHVMRDTYPNSDINEASAMVVQFESGAVGTFTSSCLLPKPAFEIRLQLVGEGFAVDLTNTGARIVTAEGEELIESDGKATLRQTKAFVNAVRNNTPDIVKSSYLDALATHKVTMAAVGSTEDRQPRTINR